MEWSQWWQYWWGRDDTDIGIWWHWHWDLCSDYGEGEGVVIYHGCWQEIMVSWRDERHGCVGVALGLDFVLRKSGDEDWPKKWRWRCIPPIQHSFRIFENIYLGRLNTITFNHLMLNNFWTVYAQKNLLRQIAANFGNNRHPLHSPLSTLSLHSSPRA